MDYIEDIAALRALYDAPHDLALDKVMTRITPTYARFIEASRFCILSTTGPSGTDASPRGNAGPVVALLDDATLAMPDWRGNNRLDSLANIVEDGRVSLMFLVPGSDNVVRVNGRAKLTADPDMTGRFARGDKHPRSVIVISVGEVYFQCAKAIMRSGLWSGERPSAPRAGDFIKEFKAGFDAESYDAGYAADAEPRMW
ncbi:pyridoxamine 5'-phosphate oxidase family protein [Rhodobacterales bacterium HKCCE3408]|nr:pyridoxamine 5'-phosphate oxidase family protein [Rhodobacterales bacterium HKCCE3408]